VFIDCNENNFEHYRVLKDLKTIFILSNIDFKISIHKNNVNSILEKYKLTDNQIENFHRCLSTKQLSCHLIERLLNKYEKIANSNFKKNQVKKSLELLIGSKIKSVLLQPTIDIISNFNLLVLNFYSENNYSLMTFGEMFIHYKGKLLFCIKDGIISNKSYNEVNQFLKNVEISHFSICSNSKYTFYTNSGISILINISNCDIDNDSLLLFRNKELLFRIFNQSKNIFEVKFGYNASSTTNQLNNSDLQKWYIFYMLSKKQIDVTKIKKIVNYTHSFDITKVYSVLDSLKGAYFKDLFFQPTKGIMSISNMYVLKLDKNSKVYHFHIFDDFRITKKEKILLSKQDEMLNEYGEQYDYSNCSPMTKLNIEKAKKYLQHSMVKQISLNCNYDLSIVFSNGVTVTIFVNLFNEEFEYYRLMRNHKDVFIVSFSNQSKNIIIQEKDFYFLIN